MLLLVSVAALACSAASASWLMHLSTTSASSPRDPSAAACSELRHACFEVLKDMYRRARCFAVGQRCSVCMLCGARGLAHASQHSSLL